MFSNDLDQSLVFTLLFLVCMVALLFTLAWLEQPEGGRRVLAWVRSVMSVGRRGHR